VVDFIDVQFGTWHYPTFNVADMSICVGAGLLIIDIFLSKKNQHVQTEDRKAEASS
jgi:signal peptidase II